MINTLLMIDTLLINIFFYNSYKNIFKLFYEYFQP